jgi:hypothetical protein
LRQYLTGSVHVSLRGGDGVGVDDSTGSGLATANKRHVLMEGSSNMLFIADIPAERASLTSPPNRVSLNRAQPKALNKIISQQQSKARAIMSELCQEHSQHQLNSWSTYHQVSASFHLCEIQLIIFQSLVNSLSLVGYLKCERRDTP